MGCRQAVRHQTLTLASVGSNPAIPARKKHLRKQVLFSVKRADAHEVSCLATHEAGLRPMKRAFGTRKTFRALRFTATKLPLHTSVASASYRRRRCFIVIRGQIRTATP